jgi:hypothetical protein
MENAVQAIRMGFSMFIFALALTTSMYIFSICGNTAQAIVYYSDEANYYDNISIQNQATTVRKVGFDTVIPTLYRYYKENFSVKIYDKTNLPSTDTSPGTLIQVFDITTENKVNAAYRKSNGNIDSSNINEEEKLLLQEYGKDNLTYLFGSPWNTNALVYAKQRVDFFVNGSLGYINNVLVDYSYDGNSQPSAGTNPHPANLKYYMDYNSKHSPDDQIEIEERFVQYNYSGDTISVGEGENIETLTGNKIPDSKVEITYTIIKKVP